MKNIIIYTQDGTLSEIESVLKSNFDYSVRLKKFDEIKEAESLNPQVIILELPENLTRDILTRNKISAPLLIVSNHILTGISARAEAYDYIIKPVNEDELKIRVENLLKIRDLKEEIARVTTTDDLTGLHNRAYFHQRLESELSRAKRYNIPTSCMLLDIDFFKVVNDMYGYDWGDVLLKQITEVLKRHVRKADVLSRYGDEEFLILLPNTEEDSAYIFAERLRKDIERLEFLPEGEQERHPITISGGISSFPFLNNADETANTLIRYAEHALYNAKKRGKNKIIQFSQINLEF